MAKPRLYLYLCGGLGNQMFQYATARALASHVNARLVIDTWSGFVRDREYKRKYELGSFRFHSRQVHSYQCLPIWLYRWYHRSNDKFVTLHQKFWFGSFITEPSLKYNPALFSTPVTQDTWLIGYWQSPNYFSRYSSLIQQELSPPKSKNPLYISVSRAIMNSESVALGIRLYEESTNPSAHSRSGSSKSIRDIQLAIDYLISSKPNVKLFIFCTHRSPLLKYLVVPNSTVFLTGDDGFSSAVDTLWLLTLCKHHIFMNSSYFWWGAWLSQSHHRDQTIIAANNFINQDTIPIEWLTF